MLLNGEPLETYRKQIREFLLSNFYVAEMTALDVDTSLLDQGIIELDGGARGDRIYRGDLRHFGRRQRTLAGEP